MRISSGGPPRHSQSQFKSKSKNPSRRTKTRQNPHKRSQNALAIATAQEKAKSGARHSQKSHRLGVFEDEDADRRQKGKKGAAAAEAEDDESGVETDDDGQGNEFHIGGVASDDDSEIDSDEAFGEGDEERFEGYTFRGSLNTRKDGKMSESDEGEDGQDDMDLLEDDEEDLEDDEDEDDGLVDLATALDQAEEEDRAAQESSRTKKRKAGDDPDLNEFFGSSSDESEDQDEDLSKRSGLQSLVSSLTTDEPASKRVRLNDGLEQQPDSIYSLPVTKKLTVQDLLGSVTDPTLRKSLKMIDTSRDSTAKKNAPRKLEVPLPQRQQDRLDRSAAYEKTNQTLRRWDDTVQFHRRAEHIQFPLPGSSSAPVPQSKKMTSTNSVPVTSLEQKIHDLMIESGLIGGDKAEADSGDDSSTDETGFDELPTNKQSLAEVQARRAELRLARELIFREEKRSKRIKKIKSKSFRRVMRKQAEKEGKANEAALAAAGIDLEDTETLERQRAEARMRTRHKDSKWAKNAKKSGKTVWDQDTKQSMIEMAQKQEELTRRIEGRIIRNEDDSYSSSEDADESEDEEMSEARKIAQLRNGVNGVDGGASRLLGLKFMQRSQDKLRKQNDELLDGITDGDNGQAVGETQPGLGRRKYGANKELPLPLALKPAKPDVYNSDGSDVSGDEAEPTVEIITVPATRGERKGPLPEAEAEEEEENPWLALGKGDSKARSVTKPASKKKSSEAPAGPVLINPKAVLEVGRRDRPVVQAKEAMITIKAAASSETDSEEDDEEADNGKLVSISREELIRKAFAGDDVLAAFQKEKEDLMDEEDEKTVDVTLPGWGSWAGDGLSKKEQARGKGRLYEKKEGLKKEDRADAKLERVIINQRRVKKNAKYLASTLPHPFETRQQYERSLRLPVGPEWTTKETFQAATKPRILLKQGIIDPIGRPVI